MGDNMQQTSLGSAGRIEIDDADAYPETMGQWDLQMRQISAGKFHGQIEYVEVAGLLLYREHYSQRAITTATTPKDSYLFACNRPGAADLNWCGKYLKQCDLLAFSQPGNEIKAITPDCSDHVIVEVPRHLLQQVLPGEDAATQLRSNYHLKTDADQGAQFIQMIDQTISTCLAQGELLNDARECRAIEVQVMDQLADLILRHSRGNDDTSRLTRHYLLNRALDYIHHQHGPITLTELAAALDTTPRSLQRAFNEILHISPIKYLRLSRMNAAHKALRAADRSFATVTSIALDWGFKELGRFACEYRQLFGESPATTLAHNSGPPAKDMYSVVRK